MRKLACLPLFAAVVMALMIGCKGDQPSSGDSAESPASGEAKREYDPGASDTEIKIGQTMPYSGPASAYGTIGRAEAAYFKRLNENGGINGRKINFISLDDAYNPAKTVEQARKLVEQEQVLFMFQPLGTPSNTAIHKYMNMKEVPQLFVSTGAHKWGDPKNFPWTMGFNPSYQLEAKTYGEYIASKMPNAKIAVLYQNDDFGKDYLIGLREGLGDKANNIVKEESYEVSDATVDSQMLSLQASKAEVFVNVATPKFAALAIRKAYDSGWKPSQFLTNVSISRGAVLEPAGLEKAKGAMTTMYIKDPTDPTRADDPAIKEFKEFMAKYYPEGKVEDGSNIYAYLVGQVLEQVLKQAGDDVSRENIMKQAANLKDFTSPLLLDGIKINTSPDDYHLFDSLQLAKFNGESWVPMEREQVEASAAKPEAPAAKEAVAQ